MKRIVTILLAAALLLSLCGCAERASGDATGSSTTTATASLAKPSGCVSVVEVSINPLFRLYLDAEDVVLTVECVNADATSMEKELAVVSKKLDEAVTALVSAANDKGFVKTDTVVQLTLVESGKADTAEMMSTAETAVAALADEWEIPFRVTVATGGSTTATTTVGSDVQGNGKPTATTTTAAPKDDKYDRAVAAIGKGEIGEAFRLLSSSTDERAAALLQHFVWQPLRTTGENPGSHTYDANGYPVTSNWGIQTVTYTWSLEGLLLVKRAEEDSVTAYWEQYDSTYDANGNLLTRVRTNKYGNGETETFTYDANGNRIQSVYDSSFDDEDSSATMTYDANGHILTRNAVSGNGHRTSNTYTYNAAGQLTERTITYSDERGTETITRAYNEKGQLVSSTVQSYNVAVTTTYAYGARGELLTEVSTWYDQAPNTYTYSYDTYGRLVSRVREQNGEELHRYSVEYDDTNDTCYYEDGWSTATYQLFYYPHEVGQDLCLEAAPWLSYFDPYLQ